MRFPLWFCLFLALFFGQLAAARLIHASSNDPETLHIGVQTVGGKDRCFDQWRPTAAFIRSQIADKNLAIVCLHFDEIEKAVYDGRVDFVIVNPALYINLEYIFGATRIATLKNQQGSGDGVTQYGSLLIKRAGRKDIQTPEDLRGKRFGAVDQLSFGGWIMAWRYFKKRGMDPYRDFAALQFLRSHENVVRAVLKGAVDAGSIRTGVLESMVDSGQIDSSQIEVIDPQPMDPASSYDIYTGSNHIFPFIHTTELYPQWALAKVHHVPAELAARVMFAFLQITPTSEAAVAAKTMGWVIPLDYFSVNRCLEELKIGPYRHLDTPLTPGQLYGKFRGWVNGIIALFVIIVAGAFLMLILNSRLSAAMARLEREHRVREQMVDELNEFKTTLDKTNDSVFIFDPETLLILYVNQGGLEQVGYKAEEMLAMRPVDICSQYSEVQFRTLIAPLLDGSRASVQFDTWLKDRNGLQIPVEVLLQHIAPAPGKGRCVAVVRNISRRLTERKEREQLQSRLLNEQKLASVGQLAAGIAHEINTPAQYVGSNIDFLGASFKEIDTLMHKQQQLIHQGRTERTDGEALLSRLEEITAQADWDYLQEEIPRAIDQSREGVGKIRSIVQAMKEFSHPGSREKQLTNLNRLLETTVTISRNEWKYVAEIEWQLDPELPSVHCLVNEMGQVFLNVLVNAAQAIEVCLGVHPEGGKGRITVATRTLDEAVEITFADTGCGIPQAIANRIFDPFFTTKEVGRGSGQGLTISYDVVVNKHGGSFNFVSREGQGTTFVIRLPRQALPLSVLPEDADGAAGPDAVMAESGLALEKNEGEQSGRMDGVVGKSVGQKGYELT